LKKIFQRNNRNKSFLRIKRRKKEEKYTSFRALVKEKHSAI
jgi:hypothetical protein